MGIKSLVSLQQCIQFPLPANCSFRVAAKVLRTALRSCWIALLPCHYLSDKVACNPGSPKPAPATWVSWRIPENRRPVPAPGALQLPRALEGSSLQERPLRVLTQRAPSDTSLTKPPTSHDSCFPALFSAIASCLPRYTFSLLVSFKERELPVGRGVCFIPC